MPEADDDFDELPSKSARKREMSALQALGEQLIELNAEQLARIPIDDTTLLQAIAEAREIKSHSAQRRHRQLIGKRMRHIDPQAIEQALRSIHHARQAATDDFHQLEELRDQLLEGGLAAIEQVVTRFADADRQHLRQLLLAHQREQKNNKPPASARKIFKYLRQLAESSRE